LSKEKQKYFLDSITLIHAIDKAAEYQIECFTIISQAAIGLIEAATSLETLEETLFILTRLTNAETALRATRDYISLLGIEKYEMRRSTFELCLELIETTPLKRPKDAINVATMLEQNIEFMVSEDTDYDKVDFIKRLHPKDLQT